MGKNKKKKDREENLEEGALEPRKKKKKKDREAALRLDYESQDRPRVESAPAKKKKKKMKLDRSISSFFGKQARDNLESQVNVVKAKKRSFELSVQDDTESDSDRDSDEAESENLGPGLGPSSKTSTATINWNPSRSRNHTLLISVNGAEDRFPIIFQDKSGQSWSSFLANLKDVMGIPSRETVAITYKLHGTNILLKETTFDAFCFHMGTAEETMHFLSVTTGQSTPSSSLTKIVKRPLQVPEVSAGDSTSEDILKKIEEKEWSKTFISSLSREQRETALRTLLKQLLVDKRCQETNSTLKVVCNHKLRTIAINKTEDPEGLEKKIRSLLTADEIRNFFNKRSKVRAVYGSGDFLLNPLMGQCPICMSLVSLGHLNDIIIKDDKLKTHIDLVHQKDSRNATHKGKIITLTFQTTRCPRKCGTVPF